jgi:hypothetical protein
MWPFVLREGHRLGGGGVENEVKIRIFGAKREEVNKKMKFQNEELHNLQS